MHKAEDFDCLTLVAVFTAYTLLALLMTFPWILRFTTHTPDSGGEPSIYLWNLWYFRTGLHSGTPFQTDLLSAPFGANLVFHTYTIGRDILAYPLLPILGLVPTHNLLTLLSFSLAGLGVFLLTQDLTSSGGASFVAGLIYTFSPYRFAHLGQYNLSTMEWLPFYAFFALRFLKRGNIGYLWAAIVLGIWTSFDSSYYDVYLALWSGIVMLGFLVTARSWVTVKRIGWLTLLLVVAHIPLFLLWRWASGLETWVGLPSGEQGLVILRRFSADLAAYIMPNPEQPLWQEWARQVASPFNGEWVVTVGIVPLLMTIGATWGFRRRTLEVRLWILSFWFFLLLSLGPFLQWYGQVLPISLPFYLLKDIPGLREARVLSRYSVMVTLSAAILTGVSLAWLVNKREWQRPQLVYCFAALIILFELLPAPLYLADRSIPSVYYTIAADHAPGAVLDLPFGLNDSFRGIGGWNPQAMYYQTVTNRPIIGAHISRTPPRVFAGYQAMSIIGRLGKIEQGEMVTADDVQADRQAVDEVVETLNLRYIVLPEWYKETMAHAYVLDVFANCLELLEDDGLKRGYLVKRPCP